MGSSNDSRRFIGFVEEDTTATVNPFSSVRLNLDEFQAVQQFLQERRSKSSANQMKRKASYSSTTFEEKGIGKSNTVMVDAKTGVVQQGAIA